jgi:sodium-independent sulfate anion transporter 11
MGCFVYLVFGSCKDVTVGPTAIMSIMTANHVHGMGPDMAVLLAFFSGIIILFLGILKLGEWVHKAIATTAANSSVPAHQGS